MRREQIEYIYSCDDDFDRFDDLTRVNSAINPHSP
jgi:predicted nucleic acid-binding protein